MSGEPGVLAQSLLLQALEQLAGLQSQVATVDSQNVLILKQHERADESRREMHVEIGELKRDIATIKHALERVVPMVDAHEKAANQAHGAALAMRILWTTCAGALGAAATWLITWLSGIHKP
jgi:chromosome segregation ATPase